MFLVVFDIFNYLLGIRIMHLAIFFQTSKYVFVVIEFRVMLGPYDLKGHWPNILYLIRL